VADQNLTATITREATDSLQLAPGSTVTALFKATDVMVASR
jgi:molybdopterin-binding protein